MGASRAVEPVIPDPLPHPSPPSTALRLLRGLSGALTAGLVLLAAAFGIVQWLVSESDATSPTGILLLGHAAGAAVAIAAQVIADRSRGARCVIACVVVLLTTAAVLWFGWWR